MKKAVILRKEKKTREDAEHSGEARCVEAVRENE